MKRLASPRNPEKCEAGNVWSRFKGPRKEGNILEDSTKKWTETEHDDIICDHTLMKPAVSLLLCTCVLPASPASKFSPLDITYM